MYKKNFKEAIANIHYYKLNPAIKTIILMEENKNIILKLLPNSLILLFLEIKTIICVVIVNFFRVFGHLIKYRFQSLLHLRNLYNI